MIHRNRLGREGHAGLCESFAEGGAPAPNWGPEMQAAMEQMLPKDVAGLVKSLIPMLSSQAWIFMGKIANPLQHKMTKDLAQARLALDCVKALLEKVDPFLSSDERAHLQQLVTELTINFMDTESSPEA